MMRSNSLYLQPGVDSCDARITLIEDQIQQIEVKNTRFQTLYPTIITEVMQIEIDYSLL